METIKDSLKDSIRRLALRNLDKEPILIHEKEKLAQQHEEIRKMKESYDATRGKYGKRFL